MFEPSPKFTYYGIISQGIFSSLFIVSSDININEKMILKIDNYLNSDIESTIENESKILNKLKNIPGIPKLYWSGLLDSKNAILIQLFQIDMKNYFSKYGKLSDKVLFQLALQLIDILSNVHKQGIIHRDIKPENIMLEICENHTNFYLIDYNLSKEYLNDENEHIKQKKTDEFIGNIQFASINSHFFVENSRKDDLESFGYMLFYLKIGYLPWKDFECINIIEKIKKIGYLKQKFINDVINSKLILVPEYFVQYFKYVNLLKFTESPNYDFIKSIFMNYFSKNLRNSEIWIRNILDDKISEIDECAIDRLLE